MSAPNWRKIAFQAIQCTARPACVSFFCRRWTLNKDIAQQLDIGRVQVSRWRERYAQSRLSGIERDLPRGAPPAKRCGSTGRAYDADQNQSRDALEHTHNGLPNLVSVPRAFQVHWRANGLKPHIVRGFKVSRDPQFVEKLENIVGL